MTKEEKAMEDVVRRSLHMTLGDVILVQGKVTVEQLRILNIIAVQSGVFFLVTSNPELHFSLLDDITLARYGMKRLSKGKKKRAL